MGLKTAGAFPDILGWVDELAAGAPDGAGQQTGANGGQVKKEPADDANPYDRPEEDGEETPKEAVRPFHRQAARRPALIALHLRLVPRRLVVLMFVGIVDEFRDGGGFRRGGLLLQLVRDSVWYVIADDFGNFGRLRLWRG